MVVTTLSILSLYSNIILHQLVRVKINGGQSGHVFFKTSNDLGLCYSNKKYIEYSILHIAYSSIINKLTLHQQYRGLTR